MLTQQMCSRGSSNPHVRLIILTRSLLISINAAVAVPSGLVLVCSCDRNNNILTANYGVKQNHL